MKFTTSYSPVTTAFSTMTKKELKEFYEWFMLNLPYCIEELMQLVRNASGFESWYPDDSPSSLDTLGFWFAAKVQKRDFTIEEIEAIKSKQAGSTETATWELTGNTKSLAVYVGMYYGEVAIKSNPVLKWEQKLGSKNFADFGQPMVVGLGAVPLNPVRVANSIACGFVNGAKNRASVA